jgi:hypothetical protein
MIRLAVIAMLGFALGSVIGELAPYSPVIASLHGFLP